MSGTDHRIQGMPQARARTPFAASVIRRGHSFLLLTFCIISLQSTANAGFMPHVTPGNVPDSTSLLEQLTTAASEDPSRIWREPSIGAGAWDDTETNIAAALPPIPWSPAGLAPFASTSTLGLAGSTPARNLSSPSATSGGGSTPAYAIADSPTHLPIPLLRYLLQRQESHFIPDAPPFELFHPS